MLPQNWCYLCLRTPPKSTRTLTYLGLIYKKAVVVVPPIALVDVGTLETFGACSCGKVEAALPETVDLLGYTVFTWLALVAITIPPMIITVYTRNLRWLNGR